MYKLRLIKKSLYIKHNVLDFVCINIKSCGRAYVKLFECNVAVTGLADYRAKTKYESLVL